MRRFVTVLLLALACAPLAAAQFKPAKYYKIGGKKILGDQVITADFNNDGVLDLAVADALSNKVSVLLGKPDGTFGPPIIFPAAYPVSIASGDMNPALLRSNG
jgi:FG-GAP-like repeat